MIPTLLAVYGIGLVGMAFVTALFVLGNVRRGDSPFPEWGWLPFAMLVLIVVAWPLGAPLVLAIVMRWVR